MSDYNKNSVPETNTNDHYISYSTVKTNLDTNHCQTIREKYYFSKKVVKCGQSKALPFGNSKQKDLRKKRSKTLERKVELSKAKLLNNIVQKIREVKHKKQPELQLSGQKYKLKQFQEIKQKIDKDFKSSEKQQIIKDSDRGSHAFTEEIQGIERIKQKNIKTPSQQSFRLFSSLNEQQQENDSKNSTSILLSFTNTISTEKLTPAPAIHIDKRSFKQNCYSSKLLTPQQLQPRSRSNSQTKITFNYLSPSPKNNKMESYISPAKNLTPLKLAPALKPRFHPEKPKNSSFSNEQIYKKKQSEHSCSYCGRSCQCFPDNFDCQIYRRRCDCSQPIYK